MVDWEGPDGEDPEVTLTLDTDDPEFVRGFTLGIIWGHVQHDHMDTMVLTMSEASAEMLIRMQEAGAEFRVEVVDADGGTYLKVVLSG